MIGQNQNPSPAQLAAWRQLWAILLTPQRRDKDATPADQARTAQEVQSGRCDAPR
jgi:hypothetical protein